MSHTESHKIVFQDMTEGNAVTILAYTVPAVISVISMEQE